MVTIICTGIVCVTLLLFCKVSDGFDIHIHYHNDVNPCTDVDNAQLQKQFDEAADKVATPNYDDILQAINQAFGEVE